MITGRLRPEGATHMMMDMSGMSTAMMLGMGVIWLLILAFLVLGIAAFVKYLRS
jgi:hypothetical protein